MKEYESNYVFIKYNGEIINVNLDIAAYLDENKKELRNQKEKERRHRADKEAKENFIEEFILNKPTDLLERLIEQFEVEQLHKGISKLPEIQHRRLIYYFFDELTYREIAELENVDHKAVVRSVHSAIKFLKKYLD